MRSEQVAKDLIYYELENLQEGILQNLGEAVHFLDCPHGE